ncbi:hypothetical protein ACRALDRAFT_2138656 [Sodiomyces alcalophilus JCM 7366]|uniref:uncharacterized protein n=1 Tax=Sodiomyces alcalophilus JCM 7366 TaxID=591952 RepID=UPI0039B67554
MLGKLFNLGAAPSTHPTPLQTNLARPHQVSLESVQEGIHTRHLLYPDPDTLSHHQNEQVFPLSSANAPHPALVASPFDYDADIDLDIRHVRVLIMQDAAGPYPSQLLFDSHGPPSAVSPSSPATTSPVDSQRTPTFPRKSSLSQASRPSAVQPDSPQPRHHSQGAFDRRSSMHTRSQSSVESEMHRARREYHDEIAAFASCTFGTSELMAYKGTSTKVHIVPGPSDNRVDYAASVIGDGRGSMGRSSMRSSRLAQSYTSDSVSPAHPSPSFTSSNSAPRFGDRKKILITRLFPAVLPNDDPEPRTPADTPPARCPDHSPCYPALDDHVPRKKPPQPKQKRTPMYAVVLVIQLPPTPPHMMPMPMPMAPPPTASATRSSFRGAGPGSFTEQDSFPSSLSSARRSGWSMAGPGFHDSLDTSYSTDLEDRMDAITQHWDIIMRTLTHLQSVVATTLGVLLRQEDLNSPDPYTAPPVASFVSRASSFSRRGGDEPPVFKPPKTNSKLIALQSQRLQNDEIITQEAAAARARVVTGLRAQRVITGQGRWGIWREEARWVVRMTGDRDHGQVHGHGYGHGNGQGFFFYNLLTGFLATHTDWLQALAPPAYRWRYYEQQKAKGDEDLFLPARTVIISQDKMLARRLVFLLSAFLPANQPTCPPRPHRPSTSTTSTMGAPFSQSPPSYVVPALREESLRRKINRRTGLRRESQSQSHSRTASQTAATRPSGVPHSLAHLAMEGRHERRVSDAGSIRSSLPISGNDPGSRKSSAATTSTITQETSIPHFSTIHNVEDRHRPRPESSSSIAAGDLKRSLKRSETSGHASTASTSSRASGSRWGSMISGLWGTASRSDSISSTRHDEPGSGNNNSSSSNNPTSPVKPSSKGGRRHPRPSVDTTRPEAVRGFPDNEQALIDDEEPEKVSEMAIFPGRAPPDPVGPSPFQSPVKTTVNPEDGVIDVDIAFPDYITSFETAVSSPSSSGYLSAHTPGLGSGLEYFEHMSRGTTDGDLPMNVAGFLQRFHQDFVLQAVPPHDDLMDQIKDSMRSEPTPPVMAPSPTAADDHPPERWVDVSSTIVADTTTQSITRLRYRRLVRPRDWAESSAGSSVYSGGTPVLAPSVAPYETQLEEEFIEEPIAAFDDTLADAVERVMALGVDPSKHSSADSSRSTSQARQRSSSDTSRSDGAAGHSEVPRGGYKTVVLSALHDVIREVTEQRDLEHQAQGGRGVVGGLKENVLREAVRSWVESMEPSD